MALRNSRNLTPVLPSSESLDLDRVVLSYDDESDTLMVHILGRGIPASGEPVSDGHRDVFVIRRSFSDDGVVGVQIEDFRVRFATEYSIASDLLRFAERPETDVSDELRHQESDTGRVVLRELLASLWQRLQLVAA